jgi:SAM-dependent methyltransferase
VREISPQDNMSATGAEQYYRWGLAALEYIQVALRAAEADGQPRAILDLPSGYGRVLRMLRAAFPAASVTACDLNADAVEFCARTFGAIPVVSAPRPEEIKLPGRYDLIWVGSLLTHVDDAAWHGFLRVFSDHLVPGGVLVFTTIGRTFVDDLRHGRRRVGIKNVDALIAAYDRAGFAYQDFASTEGYGITAVRPAWVCATLEQHPELELVAYTEGGWNGRQDAVACRRAISPPPENQARAAPPGAKAAQEPARAPRRRAGGAGSVGS